MPDTPEKPGNARPDKDRRRHPRQRIHSLSYAKMGDSNGGIVLNISEGGVSIQAAAVLDAGEKMPIWLEIPRVRERVEVTGEIVWLSSSRKEAGLRFVDLPEDKLQLIRKWMAREASPEQFQDEIEPTRDVPVAAVRTPIQAPASARARDQKSVRELVEANIMSVEEIRIFESGAEPDEWLAGPESAIVEAEREADDPGTIEIEKDSTEKAKAAVADESGTEHQDEVEHKVGHKVELEPEHKTETRIERPEVSQAEDNTPTRESSQTEANDRKAKETTELEEQPEKKPGLEEDLTTEDELIQAFGPPVVQLERKAPHTPFSSMNALSSEFRGLSNAVPTATVKSEVPAAIFAPSIAGAESPSGWRGFQVQLQTGWFLAALVLLLALISFIAGMAVRRGALNDVLAEQQDAVAATTPGSSPVSRTGPTASTAANGTASPNAAPAKPLSIEIVDTSNRRWMIPASTGANRTSVAATPDNSSTNPAVNPATTSDAESRPGPDSSSPAAANSPASRPTNTGKSDVPLVLSLPETPISATGSVAISAQRSVPMPANGADAEKNARNLQVGQLTNLVEPVYPAEAVQQKIEGTVKLHAVIGTDGEIESLAQVSGPQMLVNASMVAVRNWKYSPTRMNGRAIETQEDISFVFRLPN